MSNLEEALKVFEERNAWTKNDGDMGRILAAEVRRLRSKLAEKEKEIETRTRLFRQMFRERDQQMARAEKAEAKLSEAENEKKRLLNPGAADGRHNGQACLKHDLTGCGCEGICLYFAARFLRAGWDHQGRIEALRKEGA